MKSPMLWLFFGHYSAHAFRFISFSATIDAQMDLLGQEDGRYSSYFGLSFMLLAVPRTSRIETLLEILSRLGILEIPENPP